jgi:glycosyltransferase involved in cell wall biosynthesis
MQLLELADAFLPNSESEMRRLQNDLNVRVANSRVFPVPNGVDSDFYRPDIVVSQEIPPRLRRFAGCVLCVARIGGAKNQLGLVRSLGGAGLPLVLVGQASVMQAAYLRRLRREAGKHVNILGFVTEEEKRWLYHLARVHVLPSWIETTGLSSLEAAAMNCAIVTTSRGDAREYFGDLAYYCDPEDISSIRTAVLRAYEDGARAELAQKVRKLYTWNRAGEATIRAYASVGLSDVGTICAKGGFA